MVRDEQSRCVDCGMTVIGPEYHPLLACLAYRQCHDSDTVRANLAGVVEYGMKAQQSRVSLSGAVGDIRLVK